MIVHVRRVGGVSPMLDNTREREFSNDDQEFE
jgi:hypothetical protein